MTSSAEPFIICVGDERQEFRLHPSFFTSSRFFRDIVENNSIEEGYIPLPEIEVAVFVNYLQWLLTAQITKMDVGDVYENGTNLIKSYLLGDYLGDDKFCNDVVDSLIQRAGVDVLLASGAVALVWEKCFPSSTLRNVILELAVFKIAAEIWAMVEDLPSEFLFDLMEHVATRYTFPIHVETTTNPLSLEDTCKFHRHDENLPACSTLDRYLYEAV